MARLAPKPSRALVLIGFMGAGKSTVAGELAEALGTSVLDSDRLLEQRLGRTIAEEFEAAGEAGFREQEEKLVCELLAGATGGSVVALGGGSVLSEAVRRALGRHLVVFIDVDPELAWERVRAVGRQAGAERPLARDHAAFVALHAERQALYGQLADVYLPQLEPDAATRTLGALCALSDAPVRARLVWASSASGDYPVLIGRGLLGAAGEGGLGSPWRGVRPSSRGFCVTDRNVGALYGGRLASLAETVTIEPGEASKTLAGAELVWRALASLGVTRADHVVALGGGVIGDLAGFCAATYQRGVPVVHMPTTLLAQIDSAYGGKTGVDLPEAKNYVGAYHQPAGVLVDADTLASLPARELAAGWAEVVKTALIAGKSLWERVASGATADEATILECVRAKLAIVAEDERDEGRRVVLNLGHTVGHAIETATGYERYLHGEAVGLGLLAALRLSGLQGLRAQVRELLLERGLPTTLEAPVQAVLEAIGRDKKRVGERVPFVLLGGPGEPRVGCELSDEDVRAAVSELIPRAGARGVAAERAG